MTTVNDIQANVLNWIFRNWIFPNIVVDVSILVGREEYTVAKCLFMVY